MDAVAASPSDLSQFRSLAKSILRAGLRQVNRKALHLFELRHLRGPTARQLLLRLLDHPDPAVQEPAAYQLGWLHDLQAVDPLLDVLQDLHRHPRVRAQAAEAIGVILGHGDRRTFAMRRCTVMLIAALADVDPIVRFWACYALGSMRAWSALAVLRRVAVDDQAMCPGWWRVGEEAEDAIRMIEGGRPPERKRIEVELPLGARSS